MCKPLLIVLFALEFVLCPPLVFNCTVSSTAFLLLASVTTSLVVLSVGSLFPAIWDKCVKFSVAFVCANPLHCLVILPPFLCTAPLWIVMLLRTLVRPICDRSWSIFVADCRFVFASLLPLAILAAQIYLYVAALEDIPVLTFVAGYATPLALLKVATLCFLWKAQIICYGAMGFLVTFFIGTLVAIDIVSMWRIIAPKDNDRFAVVCMTCYAGVLASCILCNIFFHSTFSAPPHRSAQRSPRFLRGVRVLINKDSLLPDDHDRAQICTICLDSLNNGDNVRPLPKCSHMFHAACLEGWARVKMNDMLCPTCRGPGLTRFPSSFEDAKSLVDLEQQSTDSASLRVGREISRLSQSLGVSPLYARECVLIGGDIEGAAALLLEHPAMIFATMGPACLQKCKVPDEWVDKVQEMSPFLGRTEHSPCLRAQMAKCISARRIPSAWLAKSWTGLSAAQQRFVVRVLIEDVADHLWSE
eukprot:GEMP01047033.1.p1 GENE.GEMP01047033.1~~GEMP01047033.1.p1  ORF type:complete len:473 (+),score=88.43 GEMP01047033.1:70-1488(+)